MVKHSSAAAMADVSQDLAGDLAGGILAWYDSAARVLPWRTPPGARGRADPYGVWLSEVMLQQTTVPAVIPYYRSFLTRWPTVEALAAAPLEDVLAAWAGLGYYARARNLHKCAVAVVRDHGGRFPGTAAELRTLPGIGDYTAAAVAAIAFDEAATVVDGNVERVIARLFAVEEPLPGAKTELRRLAATLTPARRPGDYAQAVMDLGATICTPRRPQCLLCPWSDACRARTLGIAETLPRRALAKEKPIRYGTAYWIEAPHPQTGAPAVLLVRRVGRGLLGGMTALPSVGWDGTSDRPALPEVSDWETLPATVRHTFTHFHLELTVAAVRLAEPEPEIAGEWWPLADVATAGLPTVMKKAARFGLSWSSGD